MSYLKECNSTGVGTECSESPQLWIMIRSERGVIVLIRVLVVRLSKVGTEFLCCPVNARVPSHFIQHVPSCLAFVLVYFLFSICPCIPFFLSLPNWFHCPLFVCFSCWSAVLFVLFFVCLFASSLISLFRSPSGVPGAWCLVPWLPLPKGP